MPEDDKKPKKINTEISASIKNATDFVNSGTTFDQRWVDSYFTSNLSTSLLNFKFSNEKGDKITFSSGLLTNWSGDGLLDNFRNYQPFEEATRQRSLSVLNLSKTFDLKNDYKLNFSTAGVYVPSDGEGPTVSFLNPELKVNHNNHFGGIGGITGQNVTENQLYLFGGHKGLRVNIGAYDIAPSEKSAEFRAITSYDWKINDKNKLQFFTSYESGNQGGERFGAIYQTKIKNVSFRSDVIFNSSTANNIENINARADIPFALNKKEARSLSGVISVFAGVAGEFETANNPTPSLNLVYGIGANFDLYNMYNNKNRQPKTL
jgi:hypothetical protein